MLLSLMAFVMEMLLVGVWRRRKSVLMCNGFGRSRSESECELE